MKLSDSIFKGMLNLAAENN